MPSAPTRSWDIPNDFRSADAVETPPDPRASARLREEAKALVEAVRESEAIGSVAAVRHLCVLSDRYERLAEMESARSAAERAIELAGPQPDLRTSTDAQIRLARILVRKGDVEAGAAALTQCLERLQASEDDLACISLVLVGLATVDICRGQSEAALDRLDRAFSLARASRFTEGKGHALTAVGVIHVLSGNLERAHAINERAALLHQRSGDLDSLGKTYNNNGIAYYLDGRNFVQAIPFLHRGLDFTVARSDLLVILNVLNNNICGFEQDHLEPALAWRELAKPLITELPQDTQRLGDQTVRPVGETGTPSGVTFAEHPFITEPVIFAPIPSLPAVGLPELARG